MSMEKRNRQDLNLSRSTQAKHSISNTEHRRGIHAHRDDFINRWERIGLAARREGATFENLLCHINVETLSEAFNALDGSKALGVDRQRKQDYAKNLEANLRDLENRIHKGSYKPQPKREVLIPKANGKTRPIAISCFEDKLVEWVVGKIMECVYEPIFIRNSFGFRPYKSAHGAIGATYYSLKGNRRKHVVEIDFANCFNSIPHRKLIKVIGSRITDRRFKGLVGRFIKVGILDQSGIVNTPEEGTPQGSIMSPILANVYLHEVIDMWFIENYGSYSNILVRYADDAIFFFKKEEAAKGFMKVLRERVQKYGLSLNEEKTGMIDFSKGPNKSFHFLGFTIYWRKERQGRSWRLTIKTQQKVLIRKIQEFYHWIKRTRSTQKTAKLWELAKSKLRGHYQYYGYWMNRHKLLYFYREAVKALFKWLNRRSQKQSYTWKSFQQKLRFDPLPVPLEVAKLRPLGWNPYA